MAQEHLARNESDNGHPLSLGMSVFLYAWVIVIAVIYLMQFENILSALINVIKS